MKTFIIVLVFVSVAVIVAGLVENLDTKWELFKKTYGKSYKTLEEEKRRKEIFKKNVELIEDHNERYKCGKETYKMGINEFSDCTYEEFSKRHGLLMELPKKKYDSVKHDKHF
ncbi:hypothetical protein WA026_018513 [Henosepilachna vigintioctopunctata]|uniref:Cathepsin propeptide inhibitor domain-containing protein n=1 Tax=Henosepilachna vigintioctopunctata TaxID=420089 RepID=A0AAW1UUP2_9CUCU